jgi:16S rRNA (cytidine1402-2'-O)-methyltransferase
MSALILVATPIGNLGDLAPRAIEHLRSAGLVCCEDTRRTGLLLHNLGIDAKMMRVDEHTEVQSVARVLDVLASGRDVCLVTDAGSPGISDPGSRLVAAVIEHGYNVSAVPGPTALIMALTISGLPTDRFVFDGFLPRKGGERVERLREVAQQSRTTVLYEAPHRLLRTLEDLSTHCGRDRPITVCRELTKMHEEVWRGTTADAAAYFAEHEPQGEFVIIIAGSPAALPSTEIDIDRALTDRLSDGCSTRDAATQVSELLGVSKKQAYERALALQVVLKQPG